MIDFGSNETFIQNYQKLKSSRKMGELYKCSKSAILNHAKKIGYDNSHNKELKVTSIPLKRVIELYEKMPSAKAVGEIIGCSGTAVLNYLKNNGYQPKNKMHKLDEISDKEFIEKYDELKSAQKMGKFFKCSSTAILNRAKKIGYDVNSNKVYKLSEADKQEILASYHTKTSSELAQKYGVSRGMITKLWFDNHLLGKEIYTTKSTEIDLSNRTFGLWTVLYKTDKRSANGNIKWHCRCKCGIERDVNSAALRNGTSYSCGNHYNISRGNQKITNFLLEAGIPFETEKRFSTCKDQNTLPFDFYVNNSYLIEYDGSQHYDPNTKFDYEYTHTHDLIKSQWCKNNNIPLIRIPYTHFDNLCLKDLLLESSNFIE